MTQALVRTVLRQHPAYRDDIGDLVTRRPVPGPGLEQMDPFLFLNHHGPQTYPANNRGLPFGPHPHRGFETVTFILDGELAHNDSAGGESIIKAGGIQWMTAGSGLIHAELSPAAFKRDGGPMEILQLWVNLPSRLKMTKPGYVGLQAADIPTFTTDGGRVTVEPVSGSWPGPGGGVEAPIQSLIDIQLAVLKFKPGGTFETPVARGRTVFLYVVAGQVAVGGTAVEPWHLIALGEGDTVRIEASSDAVILLGHAEPIGEPVASHGPFVMNTVEEIRQAITDYNAGKFGPPPRV
jgi:redox-sensitive bicupin YhaK (pirin superfamily)